MCIRDSPSIPRRTGSLRGRNLFGRGQQKSARASPFSVETTRNYTSIGLAGARFFSAVALLVKRRGVVAEPSGGDRRAQFAHQGQVVVQVVNGIEARPQDFVDAVQV